MPTNEERREIAEKVRNARTTKKSNVSFEKLTPIEFMCEIAKAIGFGKQEDGSFIHPSYSGFAYRIADLIEPEPERTCTITHAVFNEGDPTGEYEAWNCSHCGELPYDDADSFSYCPCCGTKVTPIPL